jgi:hypothetical protein
MRLAAAAATAIPLGLALNDYLGNRDSGGAGYYDDYAGENFGPGGDMGDGPYGPGDPTDTGYIIEEPGMPKPPYQPRPPIGPEGLPPVIADNMTAGELEFFLQSGNLPEWAYQGTVSSRRRRLGRGKKSKATGSRSARAAVVKQVMAERGVSLPQASRIVKEEGLF